MLSKVWISALLTYVTVELIWCTLILYSQTYKIMQEQLILIADCNMIMILLLVAPMWYM